MSVAVEKKGKDWGSNLTAFLPSNRSRHCGRVVLMILDQQSLNPIGSINVVITELPQKVNDC